MPDFGSTNDLIIAHVLETTQGVTPANPAMKRLRVNGESLSPNVTYDESAEINPNYSLTDLVATGSEAGGGMPIHFAKSAALDEIMEAVLRGTWAAGVLKGGTVKRSFTIEKRLLAGGSAKYMKFPGSRYNGLSLSGAVGGPLTGSIDVVSLGGLPGLTSVVGTGSIAEPADNRILSMVDLTVFSIAGDTTPLIISSFDLGITNNIRRQQGHGQLSSYDTAYGMREITLSFDAYFESWEQMDKLLNRSNNDLSMTLTDGTNSYVIRFPKLRYRTVTVEAGGTNTDLMQTIEGRALYSPTAGIVSDITITRTPA